MKPSFFFILCRLISSQALLALIICLATFAGCAPAYHAASAGGSGYSDTQITERIFKVSFNGGLSLDYDTTESFALYRAAELILDSGFESFRVIRSEMTPIQVRQNVPYAVIDRSQRGFTQGECTVASPGVWQSFTAHLTLEAFKEPVQVSRADHFNAREVIEHLRDSVEKKR